MNISSAIFQCYFLNILFLYFCTSDQFEWTVYVDRCKYRPEMDRFISCVTSENLLSHFVSDQRSVPVDTSAL